MKIGITQTTRFLAILLIAWPALAPAAIPAGVLVFEFTGSNRIYDYSNFYECETVNTGALSRHRYPRLRHRVHRWRLCLPLHGEGPGPRSHSA